MILTIEILAIITMITLTSVSILAIILLFKILHQKRYANYIMEKVCEYMHLITIEYKENNIDDNNKKITDTL